MTLPGDVWGCVRVFKTFWSKSETSLKRFVFIMFRFFFHGLFIDFWLFALFVYISALRNNLSIDQLYYFTYH